MLIKYSNSSHFRSSAVDHVSFVCLSVFLFVWLVSVNINSILEATTLTLHNRFDSRPAAHAKNTMAADPTAISKCNTVNMSHATYSRQPPANIDPILVHRMQHSNKVPSVNILCVVDRETGMRERERRNRNKMYTNGLNHIFAHRGEMHTARSTRIIKS